jgi:hypothetical protein
MVNACKPRIYPHLWGSPPRTSGHRRGCGAHLRSCVRNRSQWAVTSPHSFTPWYDYGGQAAGRRASPLKPTAAASWRGHSVLEKPTTQQVRLLHRTITEADLTVGPL